MSTIRTRFAPSPTGFLHVGNVRAALFPWLVARQNGGIFILRIEDTDQAREVEGAVTIIKDTLSWLGMSWSEGPDISGDFGPYVQSERKDIYRRWAQKMVDEGLAYADPYSKEELEGFREEARANKKAFLYRDYRPENPPAWDGTQPLRFKSNPKNYIWQDAIMGELKSGPEVIDDFILMKSDGFPTYNFAHIIDDHEMGITHVVRGLEYISSVPRYLNLYEALKLPVPILAHAPHIMAPDGKKKLGKRDGAKSILDYRKDGYLPEAMLNFLASMGWNDGTEQELFSRDELIEKFSLERVQRSGARFDEQRLLWMNGQWIRRIELTDLYERATDYWPASASNSTDEYKIQLLGLVCDRLKTLNDLPALTSYFFSEPDIDSSLISANKQLKKLEQAEINELLDKAVEALSACDFTLASITDCLNNLLETTGQKPGILFSLIRIHLTWAPFSPGLAETISILGKETTLKRLTKRS